MKINKFLLGVFKDNFSRENWTREYIEELANKYLAKGKLSQDDLDNLQEFFEPMEIENEI